MSNNTVSELDLRDPKFRHVKRPEEELEFRGDGEIVFKDRWEKCVRKLFNILDIKPEDSECDNVIKIVSALQRQKNNFRNGYVIAYVEGMYYNERSDSWGDEHELSNASVYTTLREAENEVEYITNEGNQNVYIQKIDWSVNANIINITNPNMDDEVAMDDES